MKKGAISGNIIWTILGVILLAVGIFVLDDNSKTIAGVCIGIGSALASTSMANLFMYRYYLKHPGLKKKNEIASRDERGVAITYKAKAKAFDMLMRVLMVIPFLLILIDSSLWMILSVVAVYLFGFSVQICYVVKFNKEM